MFHAVVTYAKSDQEKFYETYYRKESGNIMLPVNYFYPEYYRSLAVRLYNFDGVDVTPQSSTVISYEDKVRWDGMHYKEVTSEKSFPSYEEAEAYISGHESGNYRIVSNNPFVSPVPLKALKHYKLIHSSDSLITQKNGGIPEVKIFEYNE
jgi:dolichyl-diphosphooligosaccharide--protein glycosyltransferase